MYERPELPHVLTSFLVFYKELQTSADFPIQMEELSKILVKVSAAVDY